MRPPRSVPNGLTVQARQRRYKICSVSCQSTRDGYPVVVCVLQAPDQFAAVDLAAIGNDHDIRKIFSIRNLAHQSQAGLVAGAIIADVDSRGMNESVFKFQRGDRHCVIQHGIVEYFTGSGAEDDVGCRELMADATVYPVFGQDCPGAETQDKLYSLVVYRLTVFVIPELSICV